MKKEANGWIVFVKMFEQSKRERERERKRERERERERERKQTLRHNRDNENI